MSIFFKPGLGWTHGYFCGLSLQHILFGRYLFLFYVSDIMDGVIFSLQKVIIKQFVPKILNTQYSQITTESDEYLGRVLLSFRLSYNSPRTKSIPEP